MLYGDCSRMRISEIAYISRYSTVDGALAKPKGMKRQPFLTL